ncbi:unnamed protein product [Ilex paraguariensis]|uniref:Uncharacterized protein n=1 Tax=Ilex paraguariensis TaxID=185542 RepID=A0ABC8RXQ1_9AQUA
MGKGGDMILSNEECKDSVAGCVEGRCWWDVISIGGRMEGFSRELWVGFMFMPKEGWSFCWWEKMDFVQRVRAFIGGGECLAAGDGFFFSGGEWSPIWEGCGPHSSLFLDGSRGVAISS